MSGVNNAKKIREEIQRIAGGASGKGAIVRVGKVVSVENDDDSCTVEFSELKIAGVRLRAVIDGKADKVVVIPVKESFVAVLDFASDYRNMIVLSVSEVETIDLKIKETTIIINKDGVVINGGDNKGLVIAENVAKKIETIEKDINSLKQAMTTWVPAPMDGGAALKGAVASWSAQMIQPTTKKEDIMNDKIKH